MYNLLLSLGAALIVGSIPLLFGFPLISVLIPSILTFPIVMFLLSRRTAAAVQAELLPLQSLMAAGKVDEAKELIVRVRDGWSSWQPLLHGQLTGQLGMIAYLQLKFDEAQPLLEQSGGQDWSALVALGCIHFRRNRDDEAWATFTKAAAAGPKEVMVYVVWATLLTRRELRSEALVALSKGLESLPENQLLRSMKNTVANKQRLDPETYPENWSAFFPEEAAQRLMMRGRRGAPEVPPGMTARPMFGPPQPKSRGKLARRR
jgi:hypothetical protein